VSQSPVRWILAPTCLAALLTSCDFHKGAGMDSAAIMAAEREWAAAAHAHDLERSVSFMADDATMFPPGAAPVVGKAAIREYMAAGFATPGFSVTWEPEAVVVAENGGLAYTRSKSQYTVPGPDGKIMTIYAKGVAIWRKDASGRWRCVVDIWNDAPATGAGTHG
jgi:uncharacterized protein (TIGR02246 family)